MTSVLLTGSGHGKKAFLSRSPDIFLSSALIHDFPMFLRIVTNQSGSLCDGLLSCVLTKRKSINVCLGEFHDYFVDYI